jgi:hypothetical protein
MAPMIGNKVNPQQAGKYAGYDPRYEKVHKNRVPCRCRREQKCADQEREKNNIRNKIEVYECVE